ncbi:MAG: MGMT family protein [Terriglobales bacterium]
MFRRIQQTIRRIPRGKVSTYGDVAYAAGFPGAARQVAWALHGSRGLPWQRVVGAGGKILLPDEAGFEQRMRLQSEGVQFAGLRVRMDLHQHAWFRRKRVSEAARRRKRH